MLNNNCAWKLFLLERGVRQACLSLVFSVTFIIATEVQAQNIRNSNEIQGIKIQDKRVVELSQYADDTTAILANVHSVSNLFAFLSRFERYAELKKIYQNPKCYRLAQWNTERTELKFFFYNITSCVLNNNCAWKLFLLERGVRQACLSLVFSVTFIIATEVQAQNIRNSNEIQGIKIQDKRVVELSQYADDTTAILANVHSVSNLFAFLSRFERYAELKKIYQNPKCYRLAQWNTERTEF